MSASDTEHRLTELEVKLSFTEDLVDHLNRLVAEQQRQIEQLARELVRLRQQEPGDGGPTFRSLRDEIPPHY